MIGYCHPAVNDVDLDYLKSKNQTQSGPGPTPTPIEQVPVCNGSAYCDRTAYWWCSSYNDYTVQIGVSNSNCSQNIFEDLGCQILVNAGSGDVDISSYCYENGPCYNNSGQCDGSIHYMYCSGVTAISGSCSSSYEVKVVCPDGESTCAYD